LIIEDAAARASPLRATRPVISASLRASLDTHHLSPSRQVGFVFNALSRSLLLNGVNVKSSGSQVAISYVYWK